MTQLTIQDGILQLIANEIANSTGNFTHTGDYTVDGTITANIITADTINVKNLVTDNGGLASLGDWVFNTEDELNGKGFSWTFGDSSTKLIYRNGGRLWTNSNFDLAAGSAYNIDSVPVLSTNSLGATVVNSKLRTLGTLNSLTVSGDASFGQFVYVNSDSNRFGIGTEEPNASLTILDNNIEIGIGSPALNLATIGTYSNHDLGIVTDNIPRITVKNNGEVWFGNQAANNSVVRIYGTLYTDNLVTDTRIDRISPLEFKTTKDSTIYGLGLLWSGAGPSRQLIMRSDPDRLWTSESFDIGPDQSYYINGTPVVTPTSLGRNIVNSNLTSLGTLQSLTVQHNVDILGDLNATHGVLNASTVLFNDGIQSLEISNQGFSNSKSLTISVLQSTAFYADANEINIGDKLGSRKTVKVFGPLTVGVNNPDPKLNFAVSGDVSIGNKRFTNGTAAPANGDYLVGDICWNQNPQSQSYIGWVCVSTGSPGVWAPFGMIN
jgi:hypothetical protein